MEDRDFIGMNSFEKIEALQIEVDDLRTQLSEAKQRLAIYEGSRPIDADGWFKDVGERLSRTLDDDDWNNFEPSLLQLLTQYKGMERQLTAEVKRREEAEYLVDRHSAEAGNLQDQLTQARSQLRVLGGAVLRTHTHTTNIGVHGIGRTQNCVCSYCQLAREVVK